MFHALSESSHARNLFGIMKQITSLGTESGVQYELGARNSKYSKHEMFTHKGKIDVLNSKLESETNKFVDALPAREREIVKGRFDFEVRNVGSWVPRLNEGTIAMKPLIAKALSGDDIFFNLFPEPAKPDAKTSENRYSKNYSEKQRIKACTRANSIISSIENSDVHMSIYSTKTRMHSRK